MLCQWHHTAVHEGGISIIIDPDGWLFTKPDGQRCDSWVSDETLPGISTSPAATTQQQTAEQDQLSEMDSSHHPDARIIRPH